VNSKLRLTLPDLTVRDRLCGAIVSDVCRDIADAYRASDMKTRARRWNAYSDTIDTTFPLAVLLYRRTQPAGPSPTTPPGGAAAPTLYPSHPFDSSRQAALWDQVFSNLDSDDDFWNEITARDVKTKRRLPWIRPATW
jgi:hypothetical protein